MIHTDAAVRVANSPEVADAAQKAGVFAATTAHTHRSAWVVLIVRVAAQNPSRPPSRTSPLRRSRRTPGRRARLPPVGPDSPCVLHVALTDIRPENVAHAVQNIPVDDIKDNAWKAGQAAAATARACARRPYASANPLQTTSAARLPCSLTSTPKWSRAWPARSSRRSSSLPSSAPSGSGPAASARVRTLSSCAQRMSH